MELMFPQFFLAGPKPKRTQLKKPYRHEYLQNPEDGGNNQSKVRTISFDSCLNNFAPPTHYSTMGKQDIKPFIMGK